jgi:hypothetical protein
MFHDEPFLDILQLDQSIQSTLTVSSETSKISDVGVGTGSGDTGEPQLSSSLRRRLALMRQSESPHDRDTLKHFYFLDTAELIQEYKQTLQTPIKVDFLSNQPATLRESNPGKQAIISKYIEQVKDIRDYSISTIVDDLQLTRPPESHSAALKDQTCALCQSTHITESTDFAGVMICLECGNQENTLNLANSIRLNHNDSKRVNICSKYSYDKKSHFLNCINQYQGKHKSGIEPDILQLIEKELERYNLIDHTKRNRRGKYQNVTKEHIFLFVKELKLTKCYGDINLIHHLITGRPLNDISHLTEKLLQDFDQFVQQHHKQFPNEFERKNFNYQHLLYQLLMRHKYPCNPTEFNFLKTIDRKYYHDEICRTIFENLGWNYSSLF